MRNKDQNGKGLSSSQKIFFSLLGQEGPKPIPPKLVQIYGYPLAAMISQLLYWKHKGKRKDGYIFKTEKEFIKELGISSAQQKLAIKKGRDFGFLEVIRKGVPAKRHYKIDFNLLVEKTIQEAEIKNIILSESHYNLVANRKTRAGDSDRTITYNTSKTTSKKGVEGVDKIIEKRYK